METRKAARLSIDTSDFDEAELFLPDILDMHARIRAGKAALICGDRVLDWAGFGRAVHEAARALLSGGIGPGDVVGLLAEPGIDGVVATFAILRAGAVVASLSGMVTGDALAIMIENSGARLLLASPRMAPLIDAVRPALAAIPPESFVVLGPAIPGWTALSAWGVNRPMPAAWPKLRGRDDLCIIYSSGTTSLPKGIVLSHACRLHNAYSLGLEMRYDDRAIVLVTTALYSNTAWSLLTTWILVGSLAVIMPKFDAAGFCERVARWRVSHTTLVPAQLQMIRDCADQEGADLSSIRTICSVGSTLPLPLKGWAMARFPCALFEVYGLTEGLVTLLKPEDLPLKIASAGRPMIGQDLRVLDGDDREVPQGQTGEIVGYSPLLMTRYHRNPGETAASLWRDPVTGRSFLRSGDLGFFDSDGYFHLVDRKKDMIVSGGVNVYPSDIERVLNTHPHIREAAVVGVADPKWGETPLAIVVPDDTGPDAEGIRAWVNERLGKHQRLSRVVFREALPRNPGGKVLKRLLVQEFSGP